MFEVAVREDVYEERQNQLRWQVKLGDNPMTNKARQEVLDARKQAWSDYKVCVTLNNARYVLIYIELNQLI